MKTNVPLRPFTLQTINPSKPTALQKQIVKRLNRNKLQKNSEMNVREPSGSFFLCDYGFILSTMIIIIK
jgi:hypothetical protein